MAVTQPTASKSAYGHPQHVVRNFLAYNNSDDGIDIFCSTRAAS